MDTFTKCNHTLLSPFLSHTHAPSHTQSTPCVTQHTATHSNRQQHTETRCNTPQHTAEHRVACWRVHTHTPHTYRVLSGPTLWHILRVIDDEQRHMLQASTLSSHISIHTCCKRVPSPLTYPYTHVLSHILLSPLSPRQHVRAREYCVLSRSVLSHVLATERVLRVNMLQVCVNMLQVCVNMLQASTLSSPTSYSLLSRLMCPLSHTLTHIFDHALLSLSLSHTHARTSTHREYFLTLLSHIPTHTLSLSLSLTPTPSHTHIKAGLSFVQTNVRNRWDPAYKAFHRIRSCGNEPIVG